MNPKTPEAPALVEDFVNTLDLEDGTDELDSPRALRRWIERRMGMRARKLDEEGWRIVLSTREALRAVLASHNDQPLEVGAVRQLNRAGARAQVGVTWDGDGSARFEASGSDVNSALGRILAAAVTSQAEGTWRRLKVCPADDCRFAFYDHSKNRSGRWCTMRICGNRAKTRSYRQRHGA